MAYIDKRSQDLANKPVGRLLWQFAVPSLIAMSANSIYNLCDSMFIGQGVGPLAIAGIAISFPFMSISSAFGAMLGVGSAAQTSIAMGEDNKRRGLIILGNMLRMDVSIALCFTIFGLLFLDPILRLFGASDQTLPYAHDYMQIIIAGNIITHVFLGLCDQLRATGNPAKSMRAHLIAVFVNLILDPIFIFGLDLGIRGAAFATVLGQICGLVYAIRFFFDKSNFSHFSREGLIFDFQIIKDIVAIGMSPFLVNVCGSVIVIVINHALLIQGGMDGDICVGVYGIASRLNSLLVMMVSGFSQGMQPIVGFNLGAKKIDRVYGVLKHAYVYATCIMTAGFLFVFFAPGTLASLFTTDDIMIERCIPAFRIMLCALPLVGGQIITTTFFQSIKKPKMSIFLSMTRQLIILLPLLFILPPILGVNGVWCSIPISEAGSAFLAMFLLWRELKSNDHISPLSAKE